MTRPSTDLPDSASDERATRTGLAPRLAACRARALDVLLSPGTVLQLGFSDGLLTRELARYHPHVVAVGCNPDQVARAKQATENLPVDVYLSPLETFEPPDGLRFDAIVSACLYESLDDPVAVLSRCPQWLTDDGVLVAIVAHGRADSPLTGPNPQRLSRPDRGGNEPIGRPHTVERLRMDLQLAGLRVRTTGGIMFKPIPNSKMHELPKELVAAYQALGNHVPELTAEIYAVAARP
ncbi:MAG: class I SAM-dependent methyltransferase [Proteobacteria bacterium]|nr:class I SAM-dependent methyltransferase [Pseudomonadota bacterium]